MKSVFLAVLVLISVVALAGCETVKGVGRDITNSSDAVQQAISPKHSRDL